MVKRWWQLIALPKSTLPNKVKKLVPKVFYSVSTVCLPRQSALSVRLCHLVHAKVKGHCYNFKQKAVTSKHAQFGNYRMGGTFDDTHADDNNCTAF